MKSKILIDARDELYNLRQRRSGFTMSIPVQSSDSDQVIIRALDYALELEGDAALMKQEIIELKKSQVYSIQMKRMSLLEKLDIMYKEVDSLLR